MTLEFGCLGEEEEEGGGGLENIQLSSAVYCSPSQNCACIPTNYVPALKLCGIGIAYGALYNA